jgi:predicted nucleic acid-binding protein
VILVDTSAWIEFLRGTGSPVCEEVDRLLGSELTITDPIAMEVLAGARDERHGQQLRGLLGRARMVNCSPPDYLSASLLYRRCRSNGETVRRLIDCLIGAVAIRENLNVLHQDEDFNVLERHTELTVHHP